MKIKICNLMREDCIDILRKNNMLRIKDGTTFSYPYEDNTPTNYNIFVASSLKDNDYVVMLHRGYLTQDQYDSLWGFLSSDDSKSFYVLKQKIKPTNITIDAFPPVSLVHGRNSDIELNENLGRKEAQLDILNRLGVVGWWSEDTDSPSIYYGKIKCAGDYSSLTKK